MRRHLRAYSFAIGMVVLAAMVAIWAGGVVALAGQRRTYQKPVQRKITYLYQQKYFLVSASATQAGVYNGLAFFITIAAKDSQGNTITNYTGQVTLSSQDSSALLVGGIPSADMRKPVSGYQHTFTSCGSGCDNGVRVFEVLINSGTPGDVISVTDSSGMTGQSLPLTYNMPANDPLQFLLEVPANPAAETAGVPVVLVALTPSGQVDTSYTGTVAISSSTDPRAEMNAGTPISSFRHTFTTSQNAQSGSGQYDNGRAVLTLIPESMGEETYTVTDTASGQDASVTVQVGPPPTAPAATAPLWRQVNGQSLPLNELGAAVMAYDPSNRQLVLLGGFGSVWVSTNDGTSWQGLSCVGPAPGGAAVTSLPQGEVVLFLHAQTWVSDNRDCFHGPAAISASAAPMARIFASLAYDPVTQQVVLFGGVASPGNRNGVWTFSPNQWQRMTINGASPAPRQGAVLAPDENSHKMLLFGGWDGKSSVYNDTWELDTQSWTWQQMHPQHQPPASYGGNIQWDDSYNGDILVACPTNNFAGLCLTWLWNGSDWQPLAGVEPGQRSGAGMAYDSATGVMTLEGGSGTLAPPPPCEGCKVGNLSNLGLTQLTGGPSIAPANSNLDDTWNLPPRSPLSQVERSNQRYPYRSGVERPSYPANAQSIVQSPPAAQNTYHAPATGDSLRKPAYSYHAPYPTPAPAGPAATLAGPPSYVGRCPATIGLKVTITASYPGIVLYRLQSNLQPYGPIQRIAFPSAGSQVLTVPWGVARPGYDWARVEITSPGMHLSNILRVQVTCR